MKSKIFLKGPKFFDSSENKMKNEGDVLLARSLFLKKRHNNVDFLLKERFSWMNKYLKSNMKIIEIGSGAGFSEFYLDIKPILTDMIENPWIEKRIDALNISYPEKSIDIIIASHNIHHFSSPYKFFCECEKVLKPNGLIIIQEINTSLIMRLLLHFMKHEGWSYDVDVFSKDTIANDPSDPWSANCAIPELLFENEKKFTNVFKSFKFLLNKKNEGFIFPLSGGVISKTYMPEIPSWILKTVLKIDKLLIIFFPNIFAMGRSVVLQKI